MVRRAWAIAALLFVSGCCALVYQTAWQREFRLIFGSSTAASAAVIAVFMGGLGAGGLLLGPRADRRRNPLRFYAALELGVAATAAATPPLLRLARSAYLSLGGAPALGTGGAVLLRLLIAVVVLLLPTLLAGGTLGAACRALERAEDRRRRATGLLYGANALGAVAGCLAATFWLLEAIGTRATLWLASAVNLSVAVVAFGISSGASLSNSPDPDVPPREAPTTPAAFVLTAAGVVGFVFFLLELVWYRLLAPILGGTVYTFGLVLAVALLGIAVGGLLYAAAFRSAPAAMSAFATTCLVEAAAVAAPYVLGDRVALLALALRPVAGSPLAGYLPGWTIVTCVVVLPASIVAGAQFPLLVALLGEGRAGVARDLGGAYFWNTVGGIAGALLGGFGLMPALGANGCWQSAALLLALLACLTLFVDRQRAPLRLAVHGLCAAGIAVAVLAAEGPTAVWRHGAIGAGRASLPAAAGPNAIRGWLGDTRRSIAWEREGIESSVAVQTLAGLSFVVNGKVDGNARNDAPTQVMGGLLGALLRPDVKRALVVGLGTGSTAGWLATVPSVRSVEVVELEPAILDVARLCAPVNQGAMQNPVVQIGVGDARERLTVGRGRYDLIFSEPSNPYRAGVAGLFTREFYASAAERLDADGVFLQWLQVYEVDERTVSTIVATLASVFPEIEVWQVHQIDLVLAASRRPFRHDAAAWRGRIREEPFAGALRAAWRATELEDVYARYVAGPALARRLAAEVTTLNTDDRNLVEFSFARTLSSAGLFDVSRLRRNAAALAADRPAVVGAIDWERVARQRASIYTIAGATPPPVQQVAEAEQRRVRAHAEYVAGDLAGAAATLGGSAAAAEGAVETTILAEGLAERGDRAAIPHIQALRGIDSVEAEAATARLALRLGQPQLARDALVSAFLHYRSSAWPSQLAMSHALALAQELAKAQPESAAALFEALAQPFSVAALEEPRRLVRLQLASQLGDGSCRQALLPFEPHVPWRDDVLRYRAGCYQRTGDPRARRAQADLEEYLRDERPRR